MLRDKDLDIKVGDKVKVVTRVKEGDRERSQIFEGVVIRIRGAGESRTFTVRKMGAGGIAVERTWPTRSPHLISVSRLKSSKVRRAKLYYLRGQVGKAARLKAAAPPVKPAPSS
jgi:large subunit ribosomal protein L19